MGMEPGKIDSILRKKEEAVSSAEASIIEEEEKLSFNERIDKAMEKTDSILEHASYVALAKQLLEERFKGKTVNEIREVDEEELEDLCNPYDPAVIVALCIRIKEREEIAVKGLH